MEDTSNALYGQFLVSPLTYEMELENLGSSSCISDPKGDVNKGI